MYREFSMRLNEAADKSLACPVMHKGRLVWVRDQFNQQTGEKITLESVRKWFSGEAWPRRAKITPLAEILNVDPVWLATGSGVPNTSAPNLPTDENHARSATPILHVPIRQNCVIEICGLPIDLNFSEAQKLSKIILAHAVC
jgi:transcriptional regulator with XRE-family HTH domain